MIGRTLAHYEVIAELGAGGAGVVYKARDVRLGRLVALKCILPQLVSEPEVRRRFEREAKAAARIEHPNVCTIFEIGRENDTEFLAEAFVDGPSLADELKKGPLGLEQALELAQQIASGLQAAHERGVVHRDVKPSNILLSEGSQVKLTDFGLAQITDATRITTKHATLGTPAYMSPEQVWGEETDARTDIWSLGVTLYQMLTGRLPFGGHNMTVIRFSILNEEPAPLDLGDEKPAVELERLIEKALRKDREERYQHADEIIADLRQIRRSMRAPAAPRPSAGPSVPPASRQTPRPVLIAAGVGLLCALGGLWIGRRLTPSLEKPNPPAPQFFRVSDVIGDYGSPAISPDGRFVAYPFAGADGYDIWLSRLSDGQKVRVTELPGNELEPSFSSDASRVAFRSEGPNEGLFLVSALGGDAMPLSRSGREPRFHPSRDRILYWVDPENGSHFGSAATLEVDGAAQHPIDFGFPVAHPIWSPDGREILAVGLAPGDDSEDWWALLDEPGAAPRRLGMARATAAHDLARPSQHACFRPAAWTSEGVLFAASTEGTDSLWLARLLRHGEIPGLELLANAPGNVVHPGAAFNSAKEVVFLLDLQTGGSSDRPAGAIWLMRR